MFLNRFNGMNNRSGAEIHKSMQNHPYKDLIPEDAEGIRVGANIKNIEIWVGKSGELCPVAVVAPVLGTGSATIYRASLHNQDYISENDIRIGDRVFVRISKNGLAEVEKSAFHTEVSKPFFIPTICPVCGEKVVRDEDSAVIRCTNTDCFAKKKEEEKRCF